VFIVILNWNSRHDTIASVESCLKLTWPNFRIVVVDNGSTDGSEEFLRRRLKDVEIIQSGSNLWLCREGTTSASGTQWIAALIMCGC
jgi:GT2 family glycosyltransferase